MPIESLLMFRCVNPCEPYYSLLLAAYQDYDGIAVGNADHSRGERFSAGGSDEREDEQREETASKLQISFHSIHRKKKGSRDLRQTKPLCERDQLFDCVLEVCV